MRPIAFHLADANPRGPARPRRSEPVWIVVLGLLVLVAMVVIEAVLR